MHHQLLIGQSHIVTNTDKSQRPKKKGSLCDNDFTHPWLCCCSRLHRAGVACSWYWLALVVAPLYPAAPAAGLTERALSETCIVRNCCTQSHMSEDNKSQELHLQAALMVSPHLCVVACPSPSLSVSVGMTMLSVLCTCEGLPTLLLPLLLLLLLLLAVSAVSSFIWICSAASISASGVVNGKPVCSSLRRRASLIRDASNPTCKAAWGHKQVVQCSDPIN
jgi:hypothetical protein